MTAALQVVVTPVKWRAQTSITAAKSLNCDQDIIFENVYLETPSSSPLVAATLSSCRMTQCRGRVPVSDTLEDPSRVPSTDGVPALRRLESLHY